MEGMGTSEGGRAGKINLKLMEKEDFNKKQIVKNSLYLFARMLLIMVITLYSSRVVLKNLGVEDYGIYTVIAGIVSMMSFLSSSVASATQRYLSFNIGQNDVEKLQKTFSGSFYILSGISIFVFIIVEIVGAWFVEYKMILPAGKQDLAVWVLHFSAVAIFFDMLKIPYISLLIARENMKGYAGITVAEAVLKLLAAFTLSLPFINNAVVAYAVLITIVSFLIFIAYKICCNCYYIESRLVKVNDKAYIKEIFSYSGWNIFGNLAAVVRHQGNNIILNIFFGVVVNTAYGLTMMIQSAMNMFVNSMQMAVNPRIIKMYAAGNYNDSIKLTNLASKMSFFLH